MYQHVPSFVLYIITTTKIDKFLKMCKQKMKHPEWSVHYRWCSSKRGYFCYWSSSFFQSLPRTLYFLLNGSQLISQFSLYFPPAILNFTLVYLDSFVNEREYSNNAVWSSAPSFIQGFSKTDGLTQLACHVFWVGCHCWHCL